MNQPSHHTPCAINFFNEDVKYVLKGKKNIRLWLLSAMEEEKRRCGEVNIIFCTDEYLHKINVAYLDHDTYTDIITFDMSEEPSTISGDIFISLERAKDNSTRYHVPLYSEISRLMIHGILHLAGYGDTSQDEKEVMTLKEDYYLSLQP